MPVRRPVDAQGGATRGNDPGRVSPGVVLALIDGEAIDRGGRLGAEHRRAGDCTDRAGSQHLHHPAAVRCRRAGVALIGKQRLEVGDLRFERGDARFDLVVHVPYPLVVPRDNNL